MPSAPLPLQSEPWATRRCRCGPWAPLRRSVADMPSRSTRARQRRSSRISRSSRVAMVETRWPRCSGRTTRRTETRAALRRTLSTLRWALGGRWLAVARDAVSLERDDLFLDVDEFRRLAGARISPSSRQAAALQRGAFLAGFGLRDSAPFDDWQELQAGTLARELGAVLDRLAEDLCARGESRARNRARPAQARPRPAQRGGPPTADRALRGERRARRGAWRSTASASARCTASSASRQPRRPRRSTGQSGRDRPDPAVEQALKRARDGGS